MILTQNQQVLQNHIIMKTLLFFRFILAISLLPATLGAQSRASSKSHKATANYYAEFAELMHGAAATKPNLLTSSPSVNSFEAFVHYRKVLKGKAEDFLPYYEAQIASIRARCQCHVRQADDQLQGLQKLACQKM